MGDALLALAVNGADEVAVVVVDVGVRLRDGLLGNGLLVSGSHGLGDAGGGDHGNHFLLVVVVAPDHAGGLTPIGDQGGAVAADHVEAGQTDEVGGAHLHVDRQIVLKVHLQLEAVVHQLVGDVIALAPDLLESLVLHDTHDLVDEVDTPVQNHAAALGGILTPVPGDTAGAVATGLDVVHGAQLTALVDVPHDQKLTVPAAVLVDRKELAGGLGGVDHLLEIGGGQGNGLLADDVLARGQSLEGQGLVLIVGDGDGDEIHRGIPQKLLQGCVGMDASGLSQRALGGLNIVNTHQIDDVAVLEEATVPAAHTAVTDDCRIFLCHDVIPFLSRNRSVFPQRIPCGQPYYTTYFGKLQGLLRILS